MKTSAITFLIMGLAGGFTHFHHTAVLANGKNIGDDSGGVPIKARLGTQETLLKHDQLGLKYFPDGAMSSLRPTRKYPCRMVVPVENWSCLVEGKSLDELVKGTQVLAPGKAGEFDNGYAGISSVYYHRDGKLYGFYHAEDQEGMPPIGRGVGVPGFYCSIGTAVSDDDGHSWQKLGQAITSAKPKNWTAFPNQPDRGCGEVVMVASRDGEYLLAYYTEHSRIEGRGVQVCLARAVIPDGPLLPDVWRKYHHGRFDQPGIGGLDTPVLSVAHIDNADGAFPHVSYSEYLDRYVMVFNVNVWKEYVEQGRTLEKSGIYVAYSVDGVQWSRPEILVRDYAVAQTGKSVSWHPTIVWSDAEHRAGWLVYSHSENWGHAHLGGKPHYMVRREIRFMHATTKGSNIRVTPRR
jgi:hypothetical protein